MSVISSHFQVIISFAPLYLQDSLQQNEHDELHGKSGADMKKEHRILAVSEETPSLVIALNLSCKWCLLNFWHGKQLVFATHVTRVFSASKIFGLDKCWKGKITEKQTRENNNCILVSVAH